jgi:hypothetical protein
MMRDFTALGSTVYVLLVAWFVVVMLLAVFAVVLLASDRSAGKIVIGVPGAQYDELARTYRRDLARHGVELELRQSTDGFATFNTLLEPSSGMHAALVKGGLFGSLQGRLASAKDRELHEKEAAGLRSIGRVFHEPIWVFTRGDLPLESLRDLKNKKVLVGGEHTATRRISMQLLKANGVDAANAKLLEAMLSGDASQLLRGEADAAILILPPENERIQQLLRVDDIRLMDFSPEAEAYTNRFPALTKVILRTGAVEFEPQIPSADITLLTTSVALVVRTDTPPALVNMLAYATVHNPKSGFDKVGDPVMFFRPGEFPTVNDPEFEVANEARSIYKSGELPLFLRVLAPVNQKMGIPFSATVFAWTHAATLVLLIPILAVLLPVMRALPAIYAWNVRRKLVYWYRQLNSVEKSLDSREVEYDMVAAQDEVERIEAGVRRIHLPHYFSDQLYDLRSHIDLVRQRLAATARRPSTAH